MHQPIMAAPRWDNGAVAGSQAVSAFLDAAREVKGIDGIYAKSSGPHVHFLVSTAVPREEMVGRLEHYLHPLAKAGVLPPIGYDVREPADGPDPEYVELSFRPA